MTRTLDGILLDIAIVRMRFAVGIVTRDQDWDEADHPRDEIGRFSLGAGSAADYQRVSEAHTKAAGEHRAASMFLDPESAGSAAHRTAADLHDTAATHYMTGSADPTSTLKSLAATSMAVSASHQARAADPSRRRVHTPPIQKNTTAPVDAGLVVAQQVNSTVETSALEPRKIRKEQAQKVNGVAAPPPSTMLDVQPYRTETELKGMSATEFAGAYGIQITDQAAKFNKDEAAWTNAYVRYAVAAIPKSHREKLAGLVGIEVVDTIDIATRSTTGGSGKGRSAGVFRRGGLPSGVTGGAIEIARTYGVGSEQRDAVSPGKSTVHEIGHAIDASLGRPSNDLAFIKSIPSADRRGSSEQEKAGRYYHLNSSETWAECYAVEFGLAERKFFGSMSRDTAKQLYSGPIEAMKKILADKGLT